MIIAFFGASCTGKTAISRTLSLDLDLSMRSCGDAVRSRARALAIPWLDLPDKQHRAVDDETRLWCESMQPCIVEGRFLDKVLFPLEADTMLICLVASKKARRDRWARRVGRPCTLREIDEHDKADRSFRMRMYASGESLLPALVIDTSARLVETCARQVKSILTASARPHA